MTRARVVSRVSHCDLRDLEWARIELTSSTIGRTASAKDVVALECSIRLDGDELTYTIRMAAVGHVLQHHLGATLRRTPA